jgi:hypothetical protein
MSSQYREGKKVIPYKYRDCGSPFKEKCSGQCSCNNAPRSIYDKMQFKHYVEHEHNQFPVVKRIPGWK